MLFELSSCSSWGCTLQVVVWYTKIWIIFCAEVINTITSVQCCSDLFIGFYKTLEFHIDLHILSSQHIAVVLQCINFSSHVGVLISKGGIWETEIVLLASGCSKIIVSNSALLLKVIHVARQVSITTKLTLWSSYQVRFLSYFKIESSLCLTLFVQTTSILISWSKEIGICSFKSFSCSSKLKFTSVSHLWKFICSLLSLEEVIICGFDSVVVIRVFSWLDVTHILETVDLFLITGTLILKLGKLVASVFVLLAKSMACVGFLSDITLGGKNLCISTWDLLSCICNISSQVVIASVLLIEEESSVIDFLFEGCMSYIVWIVSSLEIVVLNEFLVL